MKKFNVAVSETEIYLIEEIEAETEEEAQEKALYMLSIESGKEDHWVDSDGDIEVTQV